MTDGRDSVVQRIDEALERRAREAEVRIVFACESGSRAWGFPSLDSDYDVRFLYVRRLESYLSVAKRPDVIDAPLEGDLDLGGWDVRKALQLMHTGNAPLLGWLASPIVYRADARPLEVIRELGRRTFRSRPILHHYLGLSRRALAAIGEEGATVRSKRYCYAVRALLAARYVAQRREPPPMTLAELLAAHPPEPALRSTIERMVAEKALSTEADRVDRLPALDEYLADGLDEIAASVPGEREPRPDPEPFEVGFLEILRLCGQLP